jgi:hypothetical protein
MQSRTQGHFEGFALDVMKEAAQSGRDDCLNAGMNGYLSKPFSSGALLETLEKWLGPATPADLAAPPAATPTPSRVLPPPSSASASAKRPAIWKWRLSKATSKSWPPAPPNWTPNSNAWPNRQDRRERLS